MSSVAYVEIYAFFEEDLMDPKSAVGGPNRFQGPGGGAALRFMANVIKDFHFVF